jgi:acetyl-CoA carboxylase carboxyltransferase component
MIEDKLQLLREKNAAAEAGGGAARVERQHAEGKMTASTSCSTRARLKSSTSCASTAAPTSASNRSNIRVMAS